MQLCRHRTSLAFALLLSACAMGSDAQKAPVQVEEMNAWIERVHIEAERSREAIADAFEGLNALAAGRFTNDPAPVVYARFVQAIDVAAENARRFRESVGPMLAVGEPVLAGRAEALEKIASERLRRRGEVRFAIDKERFEAIKKAAVPAQEQLDAFVQSLRDHALFLGHDLNAGAIDDIQEEVKEVAKHALELDRNLESTMAAARAYVEPSSLPVAAPGK